MSQHHRQHTLGLWPLTVQNHRGPRAQASQQAVAQRVGKEQLGTGVQPVHSREPHHADCERVRLQRHPMRVNDALGGTRRAGRTDPQRRRVSVLQHRFTLTGLLNGA